MTGEPAPSGRMKLGIMPSLGERSLGAEAPHGRTPQFADIQRMAQVAEDVGLDSFWLADHLLYRFSDIGENGCWEVFTFLSGIAATTSRIHLGPLVACTSFRNPAVLAKMADSLDEISGGRFILGLGAGWHKPEYDAFGIPFDHRASRFEEALKIIVPLLREGHVDFAGEYYQARDCVLRPRGPSRNGPPIWIGADRPRMLRLVAQYADAWNTVWRKWPDEVTSRYPAIVDACHDVGRDPGTLDLTAGSLVRILGPNEPRDPNNTGIQGTPEEVARELRGFEAIGVKHLVLTFQPADITGVERFGAVIEHFRQN